VRRLKVAQKKFFAFDFANVAPHRQVFHEHFEVVVVLNRIGKHAHLGQANTAVTHATHTQAARQHTSIGLTDETLEKEAIMQATDLRKAA